MDLIFLGFLGLCLLSIALSVRKLITLIKKRTFNDDVTAALASMESNSEKAKYMVNLLSIGYILKHILTNDAPEHNDVLYRESYKSFIDTDTVSILKSIRGNISDE